MALSGEVFGNRMCYLEDISNEVERKYSMIEIHGHSFISLFLFLYHVMLLFSFFFSLHVMSFFPAWLFVFQAINKKKGLIVYIYMYIQAWYFFNVLIFWHLFTWKLFSFILSGLLSWFGIMYIRTGTSGISSSFTRNGQYDFTWTGRF